jgi:hypothetical protein
VRGGLFAIAVGALLVPQTAHAGRNFYGWLTDTDVMPERGVELQAGTWEENHDKTDMGKSTTTWGTAPFIGITDQLEVNLPVEFSWGNGRGTQLEDFGAELRYRMVSNDPVDKPPFAPLVRIAARRRVLERSTSEVLVGLSASYQSGRLHALADAAFIADVNPDHTPLSTRPGAGFSIEAVDDLRFGAEVFAHISFDNPAVAGDPKNWVIAGPNMSWTHGRFWLSAMYGIGIANIGTAPRVQWGIAF